MGASVVVVDDGLEAASSGKVTETRNKKVLCKLECIEHLQVADNNNVPPNILIILANNTNLHVPLLIIYQISHIVSNYFKWEE